MVNLITNAPEDGADVVDELIAHPATRRVNFTGSTKVGRIIAEKAGRHLKRVVLELGGKAPMIVLSDADLDRAAAAASFGAFFHRARSACPPSGSWSNGRSPTRSLTNSPNGPAHCRSVTRAKIPRTAIGPLVNASAIKRVCELVQDALSKGAKVLSGGQAEGPCFPPTVIAGVTADMRLYREESFGPLLAIIPVAGPDEAVRVANDTEYGLSAAVFSENVPAALELAQRIESGICHINDTTVHDEPQMPFGGVKASGYGRFGGRAALEEFTELRWITVQQLPRQYPI